MFSWVCYDLDLKCLPKVHLLKSWSLAHGTMGRKTVALQEVGPNQRKLGYQECALEGNIETQDLSLWSSVSQTQRGKRYLLPHTSTLMFCLVIGPKATGPSTYGLQPLKL